MATTPMSDQEQFEWLEGCTAEEIRTALVYCSGYAPKAFAAAVRYVETLRKAGR